LKSQSFSTWKKNHFFLNLIMEAPQVENASKSESLDMDDLFKQINDRVETWFKPRLVTDPNAVDFAAMAKKYLGLTTESKWFSSHDIKVGSERVLNRKDWISHSE
jgi:hypothetical protein